MRSSGRRVADGEGLLAADGWGLSFLASAVPRSCSATTATVPAASDRRNARRFTRQETTSGFAPFWDARRPSDLEFGPW